MAVVKQSQQKSFWRDSEGMKRCKPIEQFRRGSNSRGKGLPFQTMGVRWTVALAGQRSGEGKWSVRNYQIFPLEL